MLTILITLLCWQGIQTEQRETLKLPPKAPVREVVDRYFGHEIRDPYRYMEEGTPEAAEWMRAQARYTEQVLGAMPERARLRERIRALDEQMPPRFQFVTKLPGDLYLYSKAAPRDDLYKLYVRRGLPGAERLLVDPAKYRKPGGPAASLELVYPSHDGALVAYAISIGNSERADLYVMNTRSGRVVEGPIPSVLRFGPVTWSADNRVFFYTRMPVLAAGAPEKERYLNSAVYRHIVGTDARTDRLAIGPADDAPLRISAAQWASIELPSNSRWAVAAVSNGVDGRRALHVAPKRDAESGNARWRRVAEFNDEIMEFAAHGDDLFVITSKGAARGRVLKARLPEVDWERAQAVLADGTVAPTRLGAARDGLYIGAREGVAGRLFRTAYDTGKTERLHLPAAGIAEIDSADPRQDGIVYRLMGWTNAPRVYEYRAGSLVDTKLSTEAAKPVADLEVTQAMVTSYDGVKVPLTLIHRRGLEKNGDNRVYLAGYGSYGVSMDPFFDASAEAWYEAGGAIAVAHVRGGGEFGEEWHRAGQKGTKANTWRDFIACAEYLVREKYTRPERMAGWGTSAGGILIGRAITERPELFGAAVIAAGTTDMLRGEFQKNGPVNIPEFGTVTKAEDFPALLEMSAYHHVENAKRYPAVLLTTGMNDPAVDPWQPAKFAARLQAASASGKPVLLRVDEGGHDAWGSTKSQLYDLRADQLTFLLWQTARPTDTSRR